jgi:hypothetical protein
MAKTETKALLKDLKSKTEFCIKEAKSFLKQHENKLNNKQNPESWSALQCLDHLNQYGDYYLPEIEKSLEEQQSSAAIIFKPGFVGNIFANSMNVVKSKSKMQSPVDKTPSKSDMDKETVNTFLDQQKRFLAILQQAENIDVNKHKINISISKWIKLKLGDALRVTIYHNERHVIQAIKALKRN